MNRTETRSFLGLILLIVVLHFMGNILQSLIYIMKIVAIALLILVKLRANSITATYLSRGLSRLRATRQSSFTTKSPPKPLVQMPVGLVLAKKAKDLMLHVLGMLLDISSMRIVEAENGAKEIK